MASREVSFGLSAGLCRVSRRSGHPTARSVFLHKPAAGAGQPSTASRRLPLTSPQSPLSSVPCRARDIRPLPCLNFRFVGPLPPVLISRYAKNHSPDDFCLRLLRKKSRLHFLFVCKRTHDENAALPLRVDAVPSWLSRPSGHLSARSVGFFGTSWLLCRTDRYRLPAAAPRSPSFVKPQGLRLNKFGSLGPLPPPRSLPLAVRLSSALRSSAAVAASSRLEALFSGFAASSGFIRSSLAPALGSSIAPRVQPPILPFFSVPITSSIAKLPISLTKGLPTQSAQPLNF